MEQKYHRQAEEAGVFIVSACAFDSIPHDVGVRFTEESFSGMYTSDVYLVGLHVCVIVITVHMHAPTRMHLCTHLLIVCYMKYYYYYVLL